MRKRVLWVLTVLFAVCLGAAVFVACGEDPAPDGFTVTYADGVTAEEIEVPVDKNTYKQDDTVTVKDGISREGYTFEGWGLGTIVYQPGDTFKMPARNITLTAKWEEVIPVYYTVTYDLDGGDYEGDPTAPTEDDHKQGESFTLAAAPAKDGYKFLGWSDGEDLYAAGGKYTMPGDDVTLTAQWAQYHTVTYSLDGGSWASPSDAPAAAKYVVGDPVKVAAAPVKSNHKFLGWSDGDKLYAAGDNYSMPNKNVTFTAQWAQYHTVTYSLGDYTDYEGDPITEADHLEGEVFYVKGAPNRDNYTFLSWYDGTRTYQEGNPYTMPDSNVTFTAQWQRSDAETYAVTFELDGGDWAASGDAPQADLKYAEGVFVPLPKAPVKDGYKFIGWSDGVHSNLYPAEGAYEMPGKPVTFTAQWTLLYSVIYDLDNGQWESPSDEPTQKYAEGDTVTLPKAPVRDGYIFTAWLSPDGATYAPGETYPMPEGNVTFTAQWKQLHTVTYNLDDGHWSVPGDAPAQVKYAAGATVTLPKAPVKDGYVFLGWKAPDGKIYAAGANYTMPDGDATLTAQWERDAGERYGVIYKLNGGRYNGGSTAPTEDSHAKGETFAVAGEPTRDGYKFLGWSDGTRLYAAGETYTMPEGAVTLTAQWAQYHTVTYDLGEYTDYTGTLPKEEDHVVGDTFKLANAPARSGYVFVSWSDGMKGYQQGETYTMPDSNVILTANWRLADAPTYSVTYDLGYSGAPTITEQNHAEGEIFSLAAAPTRSGYRFYGWYGLVEKMQMNADGYEELVSRWCVHKAGGSYTMLGKNVTIKALWQSENPFDLAVGGSVENVIIGYEEAKTEFRLTNATPGDYKITLLGDGTLRTSEDRVAEITVVVGEQYIVFAGSDFEQFANIRITDETSISIFANEGLVEVSVQLEAAYILTEGENTITIGADGRAVYELVIAIPGYFKLELVGANNVTIRYQSYDDEKPVPNPIDGPEILPGEPFGGTNYQKLIFIGAAQTFKVIMTKTEGGPQAKRYPINVDVPLEDVPLGPLDASLDEDYQVADKTVRIYLELSSALVGTYKLTIGNITPVGLFDITFVLLADGTRLGSLSCYNGASVIFTLEGDVTVLTLEGMGDGESFTATFILTEENEEPGEGGYVLELNTAIYVPVGSFSSPTEIKLGTSVTPGTYTLKILNAGMFDSYVVAVGRAPVEDEDIQLDYFLNDHTASVTITQGMEYIYLYVFGTADPVTMLLSDGSSGGGGGGEVYDLGNVTFHENGNNGCNDSVAINVPGGTYKLTIALVGNDLSSAFWNRWTVQAAGGSSAMFGTEYFTSAEVTIVIPEGCTELIFTLAGGWAPQSSVTVHLTLTKIA